MVRRLSQAVGAVELGASTGHLVVGDHDLALGQKGVAGEDRPPTILRTAQAFGVALGRLTAA